MHNLRFNIGSYLIELKLVISADTKEIRVSKCFINKLPNDFSRIEPEFKLSSVLTYDYIKEIVLSNLHYVTGEYKIVYSRQARKRLRRFNILDSKS